MQRKWPWITNSPWWAQDESQHLTFNPKKLHFVLPLHVLQNGHIFLHTPSCFPSLFSPKWARLQKLKSFQFPCPGFALPAIGFLPVPGQTWRWRSDMEKGLRKQKRIQPLCKVATCLCQVPDSAALASLASQWYGNEWCSYSYSCMVRWMTCRCIFCCCWGKIKADTGRTFFALAEGRGK